MRGQLVDQVEELALPQFTDSLVPLLCLGEEVVEGDRLGGSDRADVADLKKKNITKINK